MDNSVVSPIYVAGEDYDGEYSSTQVFTVKRNDTDSRGVYIVFLLFREVFFPFT